MAQQRVKMLDRLTLVCFCVGLALIVVDIITQVYEQALLNLMIIVLAFVPVLLLQKQKKYSWALAHFMVVTTAFILLGTFLALKAGRLTDTENILIGFSAVGIFLMDRTKKIFTYALFICTVLGVKAYKAFYIIDQDIVEFTLVCVNYLLLFLAIYFFLEVYRNALTTELNTSQRLNEELTKGKKEVEQTRGMLSNMVDNIPLMLAMLDNRGRFLSMNKQFAHAMGYDERQMLGKNYLDILPSKIKAQLVPRLASGLMGEELDFDELIQFPSGQEVQALGQVVPLFNDMGVYGLTVIISDIGELKEKERNLENINETKNKLFSIIAHDLRNPLNLLHGLVQLNKTIGLEPDQQEMFIDRIQKNLSSVNHMLENLLQWARSQLEGYSINPERVNLNLEVDRVCTVYQESANNKMVSLETAVSSDHFVEMDKNHLNMIIRNILNNAIKFSNAGGSIKLFSEAVDGTIYLRISDSGVGMDSSRVKSILSKQFVHSEYGTEGESGTGLGLALSMEMLNQNNAHLELTSQPGAGSTFSLKLPASSEIAS